MQRDFFDEMDLRLERLEEVQAEMESNLARLKKRLTALRSAPPPFAPAEMGGDDATRHLRVQQRIIEAAMDIVAADCGTDYKGGECLWALSCVSRNLRERIAATPTT